MRLVLAVALLLLASGCVTETTRQQVDLARQAAAKVDLEGAEAGAPVVKALVVHTESIQTQVGKPLQPVALDAADPAGQAAELADKAKSEGSWFSNLLGWLLAKAPWLAGLAGSGGLIGLLLSIVAGMARGVERSNPQTAAPAKQAVKAELSSGWFSSIVRPLADLLIQRAVTKLSGKSKV